MTPKSIPIDERLGEYLVEVGMREPAVLARLRADTAGRPHASMQTAPEQGALLHFLARLVGARRILEVGVFTGYSATWLALALEPGGTLVACDRSAEWTDAARGWWAEAGVADRIDLRLGDAIETLDGLLDDGEADAYDLAYIDADKTSYAGYYERALRLVRAGGVIAVDNTLWSGRVADPDEDDATTVALRALNASIHADERVDMLVAPLGDGLTLCRRRV